MSSNEQEQQVSIITEQGDLGLGNTVLTEEEQNAIKEK